MLKKLKRTRFLGILFILISVLLFVVPAVIGWEFYGGDFNLAPQWFKQTSAALFLSSGPLFIIGLILFFVARNKLRSVCTKCGASLIGAAYEIEEAGEAENNSGDIDANVEFKAKCPGCGKEKVFYKKYRVYTAARYNSQTGARTSSPHSFNIQTAVKKDAEKYFGKSCNYTIDVKHEA